MCLAILILGYLVYGRVVERVFSPDDRVTPATRLNDGVDFAPLPVWRAFLIQLLNIAGTGPIFGALMGAVFGPVVLVWIVLGSILGGAVHDYMTGMISMRMDGETVGEIVNRYFGKAAAVVMRGFSGVLLLLVGAVFTSSPAALLARLTPNVLNIPFWTVVILIYYLLATLLPIDKLISKLYPFFGAVLIFMAVSIPIFLVAKGYTLPELNFENLHPDNLPRWPFMCITVACGAISGFHATQSPIISRCLASERSGRKIFYGAMIAESIIAMVWATAGIAFYQSTGGLQNALATLQQSGVVYDICTSLMGVAGGVIAIVGVVACPITSGDTAFRSARLALSDWIGLDQKPFKNRLLLSIPCLAIGAALVCVDFNVVWRYFAWSNQTLATIMLWTASMYLVVNAKDKRYSLLTAIPAAFMTAAIVTYILAADEGLRLGVSIATPVGFVVAIAVLAVFVAKKLLSKGAGAPLAN